MQPQKVSERFLVIRSQFNEEITEALLAGAKKAFEDNDVPKSKVCIVEVAGAFDIPHIAAHAIHQECYTAIVAIGCVIRGDTPHFDYIAAECARGLMNVSTSSHSVPVVFGVLTTNTEEQARERAGLDGSAVNRGYDAVLTALASRKALREVDQDISSSSELRQ